MSGASMRVAVEPRLSEQQVPSPDRRVVVLTDRLPVYLTREAAPKAVSGQGTWRACRTRSALATGLAPRLRDCHGIWLGWPGAAEDEAPELKDVLAGAIQEGGYSLRPVSIPRPDIRAAFDGFGSEVIWPLFHGQISECRFDAASWQAYRRVNRKFARAAARAMARSGGGSDFLWVHDHSLMNVALELRRLGVLATPARTGFFLHIPFPSPDQFLQLPWRHRLLAGLLAHDQIGFQTARDLKNFLDSVRSLVPGAAGAAVTRSGKLWRVRGESRTGPFALRAGVFPIGIDFQNFAERAGRPEVEAAAAAVRAAHRGRALVLGADRLDRSRGIPEKLRAFGEMIERYPEMSETVTLIQIAVPSGGSGGSAGGTGELPRERALREEVQRLVADINGRLGRAGWMPVHYISRSLGQDELLALYRAADVALVTPLREGMGMVAKEFCAADVEERGVLVLSEFAGAAAQLSAGALLVNPFHSAATARTLCRALRMGSEERASRMAALRASVRRHDVSSWADAFLGAAFEDETGEAPEVAPAPLSRRRARISSEIS